MSMLVISFKRVPSTPGTFCDRIFACTSRSGSMNINGPETPVVSLEQVLEHLEVVHTAL